MSKYGLPETAGQRLPASLLRGNELLLDDFLGGDCFDLFLMARRDGARNVGIGLLGLSLDRGFGLPPPHLIPVAHGWAPFVVSVLIACGVRGAEL